MPEQGIYVRLAAAEGDKQIHGIRRTAAFEYIAQKRVTGLAVEHSPFLEEREGVCR